MVARLAYIVVCLTTGVRSEEAGRCGGIMWTLSLQGAGVPPHIIVWRSVRSHGPDTKTNRSRRTLKLPEAAVEALRAQMRRQAEVACQCRGVVAELWPGVHHVRGDGV